MILYKDLDSSISEAQAPIDALEMDYKQTQTGLNVKINEAQRLSQELNMSVDKLGHTNKGVERYNSLLKIAATQNLIFLQQVCKRQTGSGTRRLCKQY